MRWPSGIRSSGVASGIKPSGKLDLGVLVADEPLTWAGTFTKNGAAAPCVLWNKRLLGARVRALVANSGNANACTGEGGPAAVETTARRMARELGCSTGEVLVASTGVIGIPLPVARMLRALPDAMSTLSRDPRSFGQAILTSDKTTKVASRSDGGLSITAVGKGSAMLAPSMATMLAFVVTDAAVSYDALQACLDDAVRGSFDRISVDACESTNDSVFLIATGTGGNASTDQLRNSVASVCAELAEQMVRDAEGGSKLMRIRVVGARDEDAATSLGKAVAASALWRAAVHGGDPNWGRVLAALGSIERSLELSSVELAIGPEVVFSAGEPVGTVEAAQKAMAEDEVVVTCRVGQGSAHVEVLSADLSPAYVSLNAFSST